MTRREGARHNKAQHAKKALVGEFNPPPPKPLARNFLVNFQSSVAAAAAGGMIAPSQISVTTPEDGIYMEDVYPNSGKVVARKLVAALMSHYPDSMVSGAGNRGVYLISD